MVAHLHLITSAKGDSILSEIIRDFKKSTAIIAGISTEPETLPSLKSVVALPYVVMGSSRAGQGFGLARDGVLVSYVTEGRSK
ncbi:hypothetical protein [Reichenbachiella agariperforans]|uniref:hypothetical protein n=1 Tax=Reichenbachiella agariperforans TaxID=156994 RepID=UPI001C088BE6|nr:hypothetical protein [Reichenbachiella agariperforans]MBU2915435.1 hypothetical protein [Reichenbachiella agariperforans]